MEAKRRPGRPRKYFTDEEIQAAKKRTRDNFTAKTRIKTLNIYGDDLDLLRELAARSETSLMKCFSEIIRNAKEEADEVS